MLTHIHADQNRNAMQCNTTGREEENKKNELLSVILRGQVRPASVVMSSSPIKPLYPKQEVISLLAKTDGLS